MKTNWKKLLSLLLCGVLVAGMGLAVSASVRQDAAPETPAALTVSADAGEKPEADTVYVFTAADGQTQRLMRGEETVDETAPIDITVTYTLDGQPVTAADLAGKSGHLVLRVDYTANQTVEETVEGEKRTVHVPYAVLTGLLLDDGVAENVTVTNGRVHSDETRTVIVGYALPGLGEDLALRDVELPESVEIEADVTDFHVDMLLTLATKELFAELDAEKLDDLGGLEQLSGKIGELTDAMARLLDGSRQLADGLVTLQGKTGELKAGVDRLADGAKTAAAGAAQLADGAKTLSDGAATLSAGLGKLDENSAALNGGAAQVYLALLETAHAQLTAAGLEVPELTIANYAEVLTQVIASLDPDAVYQTALAQVTAAVEANRDAVVAAVTAAVRQTVTGQVVQAATGLTPEEYEAAVAAGQVSAEVQAQIDAAVDAQMQTEEVQTVIAQNVEAQIAQLIADAMASDEVQAKLAAAAEGAKSVIALKTSLDSYNAFYWGLQAYTAGVGECAKGAAQLADGAAQLQTGAAQLSAGNAALADGTAKLDDALPALQDGVAQLANGAGALHDGLGRFNDEAVTKLVAAVEDELEPLLERLRASVNAAQETDSVRYIYKTEGVG